MSTTSGPGFAAIMADHDKGREYAFLECVGENFSCPATIRIESTDAVTDAELIARFAELGWSVNPTLCPQHREIEQRSTV